MTPVIPRSGMAASIRINTALAKRLTRGIVSRASVARPRCAAGVPESQVFQDRAIGPAVTVAVVRQMLECRHHRLQLDDAAIQVLQVVTGDLLNRGAGTRLVAPKC